VVPRTDVPSSGPSSRLCSPDSGPKQRRGPRQPSVLLGHPWTFADGAPKGAIADAIKRDFGSFEQFQSLFTDAATKHFGSGWAFLVVNPSRHRLEIVSLPNQDSVLVHGTPGSSAAMSWEHAYYLKYRNRRPDYLSTWWKVIAWDVVDERLRDVMAETSPL
jgi:superoxide dismutase